jgi:aspartate ammonia-lyase
MRRNASVVLTSGCIRGIQVHQERCRSYVDNSIGLVTALNPVIGKAASSSVPDSHALAIAPGVHIFFSADWMDSGYLVARMQ